MIVMRAERLATGRNLCPRNSQADLTQDDIRGLMFLIPATAEDQTT